MRRHGLGLVLGIAITAGACGGSDEEAAQEAQSAVEALAAAVAAAEPANQQREVSLAPLPLEIEVPGDSMGAMDMSIGDRQSVTVDIGNGRSLNITVAEGPLAQIKQGIAEDTIMFPFRSWEREEGNTAVYGFTSEGNTRYHGFTLRDIGGQSYLCKTTGLDGLASVDEVNQALQSCQNLQAAN